MNDDRDRDVEKQLLSLPDKEREALIKALRAFEKRRREEIDTMDRSPGELVPIPRSTPAPTIRGYGSPELPEPNRPGRWT